MSREFRAIVGAGISIATLILGLGAPMVTALVGINDRLDSMQTRLDSMQVELSAIGQRVACIESRLDNRASREERP